MTVLTEREDKILRQRTQEGLPDLLQVGMGQKHLNCLETW